MMCFAMNSCDTIETGKLVKKRGKDYSETDNLIARVHIDKEKHISFVLAVAGAYPTQLVCLNKKIDD